MQSFNPLALFNRRKKTIAKEDLTSINIPAHIAVIMDGNRRWAEKRNLPKIAGYKYGLEALREIYGTCIDIGIKYLTVYAFSTENNLRPKDELKYLEWLLVEAIETEKKALMEKNVRLRFLGRISEVDENLRGKMAELESATSGNTSLNLQLMYNYGGRAEIVDSVKKIADKIKSGINVEINEKEISDNLYLAGIPDPDLLIRTGGEMRISNFLLWEIAYSEIFVTDLMFPDFRRNELVDAVKKYSLRSRRFGK